MEAQTEATTPLDELARDLHELRARAGSPSYAEIARRIGEHRAAQAPGAPAVRPSKTTVYDVFRYGRRRVDVVLALEIVAALGCDDTALTAWRERYEASALARTPALPTPRDGHRAEAEAEPTAEATAEAPARVRARTVAGVLLVCLLINVVAGNVAEELHLTLYLDMVGTAVAALALGPWWGAGVGAVTNVLEWPTPHGSWQSVVFGIVNVTGALVWGYGARRYGMTRTIPRFFTLNAIVAVICTIVAVPLQMILFSPGHTASDPINLVIGTLRDFSHNALAAVFSSNLLTSLADKLISGFLALTALEILPRELRQRPRA